jgi:hypothetical protein
VFATTISLEYQDGKAQMNMNQIDTAAWSNSDSERLYVENWPTEPDMQNCYENGIQCGGCSFYAEFNCDWGLCCNPQSRHYLETVFEHFTCPTHVNEGWGPHSFTDDNSFHCQCQGAPVYETVGTIITLLDRGNLDEELRSHLRVLRKYVERIGELNT